MLGSLRADIDDYLATTLPTLDVDAPVVAFLPDDVSEVPCVVVGRPALEVSENIVATYTLNVIAIGRRIADEDAQVELDELGDALIAALAVAPGGLRFVALDPTVTTVAGVDHPSYTAQVAHDDRLPCTPTVVVEMRSA